jgi:glycine C-acetyltransferase
LVNTSPAPIAATIALEMIGPIPGTLISTPQGGHVRVSDGQPVLNLCANNYLGLAQHPAIQQAAHEGLERWGYGLASVRFICGTQGVHKQLEAKLTEFLGTEDTILYTSCWDANGGLFES